MEFITLNKYHEKDPFYRKITVNADEIAAAHTFMNEAKEEVTEIILKSGLRFLVLEDLSDLFRFLDMAKEGKDKITDIESDLNIDDEEGWEYEKPFSCY